MKRLILIVCVTLSALAGNAQDTLLLDKIVAIVGKHIIMESDLRSQVEDMKKQGQQVPENFKCLLLEEYLVQKLLLVQADRDSIVITDAQVENDLDRRLKLFISKFSGDVKAFEDFYGKTIDQFKEEYRDDVYNLLLIQQMQSKINGNVDVSPTEVRDYFNSLPVDSIPYINAEVEIGEIVKKPKPSEELKKYAKDKAEELRQRAIKGEDFTFLVRGYSMDPGSNGKKGGPTSYENIGRGTFVPEFDQYAFSMNVGDISPVFETSYGFHVMKLLARRGDYVDLQHILVTVEIDEKEMDKAYKFLDSLRHAIMIDSITFTEAASRFSDDEDSRVSGGSIYNPFTGQTRFEMDQISQYDPGIFLVVDKLGPKEISVPMIMQTRDGKQGYRILYIKSRTEPHKANLKQDYQRILEDARVHKEEKLMKEWVKKKVGGTYVWVAEEYRSCKFENDWLGKR